MGNYFRGILFAGPLAITLARFIDHSTHPRPGDGSRGPELRDRAPEPERVAQVMEEAPEEAPPHTHTGRAGALAVAEGVGALFPAH